MKFPFPRSSRNSPQVIPEKDNLSTSTRLDSSSASPGFGDSSISTDFNYSSSGSTFSFACSTPFSNRVAFQDITFTSRQAMKGQVIRKQNNKVKLSETADLKAALSKSENENESKDVKIAEITSDLRKLNMENDALKEKLKHSDDWLMSTFKKC